MYVNSVTSGKPLALQERVCLKMLNLSTAGLLPGSLFSLTYCRCRALSSLPGRRPRPFRNPLPAPPETRLLKPPGSHLSNSVTNMGHRGEGSCSCARRASPHGTLTSLGSLSNRPCAASQSPRLKLPKSSPEFAVLS